MCECPSYAINLILRLFHLASNIVSLKPKEDKSKYWNIAKHLTKQSFTRSNKIVGSCTNRYSIITTKISVQNILKIIIFRTYKQGIENQRLEVMPNIVYNSVMTEMLEKSPEIKRWRQIAKPWLILHCTKIIPNCILSMAVKLLSVCKLEKIYTREVIFEL